MNYSIPGFPVLHQLLEFVQTHVHGVDDTIQPSHPLSSPSPPTFNPSQYQDLFQWVSSLHQVAKLLEFSASASNPSNEYSGLISFWIDLFRLVVKPSLKDVEGNLASLLNEHSCVVVWPLFGIALLWDWNESWSFLVLWPLLSFPNWLTYWVQHITF